MLEIIVQVTCRKYPFGRMENYTCLEKGRFLYRQIYTDVIAYFLIFIMLQTTLNSHPFAFHSKKERKLLLSYTQKELLGCFIVVYFSFWRVIFFYSDYKNGSSPDIIQPSVLCMRCTAQRYSALSRLLKTFCCALCMFQSCVRYSNTEGTVMKKYGPEKTMLAVIN